MRGLQCEKSLYLTLFHPELEAPPDAALQARFTEGTMVGERARQKYPEGVLIPSEALKWAESVALTSETINAGTLTIFEAALQFENYYSRVDVFRREHASASWQIIEVKSTASVKQRHILDVAIQAWIAQEAGFEVSDFYIMHINNKCVAPDFNNLFTTVDVTVEVREVIAELGAKLLKLASKLEQGEAPQIPIGPHCKSPYECPFTKECWQHIPTPSVFDIPALTNRVWKYHEAGIIDIKDVNAEDFKGARASAVRTLQTGERWVERKKIGSMLENWQWPLYFLDFETLGGPIPAYNGTSPFQKIPFQFSCHVMSAEGANTLDHREYLHTRPDDPRSDFVKALLHAVGDRGSIVAYNAAFEASVMNDLANLFPQHQERLRNLRKRLVDPLKIFRSAVYDAKFLRSFSIKSVAPAILGDSLSYKNLAVQDGGQAQQAFIKMIFGTIDANERAALEKGLREYCRMDTLAMVELVKWLFSQSHS